MNTHFRWMLKKRFFSISAPTWSSSGTPRHMGPLFSSLMVSNHLRTNFSLELAQWDFFLLILKCIYTLNELDQSRSVLCQVCCNVSLHTPVPREDKWQAFAEVYTVMWQPLFCFVTVLMFLHPQCIPHTMLPLLQWTNCWLSSKITLVVDQREILKNFVTLTKLGMWPGSDSKGLCYIASALFP